jgi:hypothetical protein
MQNYYGVLKKLLPPGQFWEIKKGSAFDRILHALSQELDRIAVLAFNLEDLLWVPHQIQRFLILLDLENRPFPTDDDSLRAIESILAQRGSLSRAYVEQRLHSLGYSDFKFHDLSEDDLGVEPSLDPEWIGKLFVHTQIKKYNELQAGAHAGDLVREWRDFQFEKDVKSLVPAHANTHFLYADTLEEENSSRC